MVPEQPARKEISSITGKEAGNRSVIEVRVRSLALLESDRGALSHRVQRESAVLVSHGVPFAEESHVHRRSVAGNVEVVAGVGGVRLDKVMRAIQPLGFAC